jgi:tetratricopeptide (TPR) repeat protein
MRAFSRITLLFASIVLLAVNDSMAQRIIEGTVYKDGEPAAGITVEAHRGSSMMTSFDGKYKVEADAKSKFLKFTYIDESKKLDLDENSGDHIDFAFTGQLPSGNTEEESGDAVLKTHEELIKDQDKDYMNDFSLYTEFYKQSDFVSAIPHWKRIFNKYPKSSVNVYIHGAKIYEYLIENAKTDAERDKYLDEYMKMYDKKIKYFGQHGYNIGRKATSWLKYNLVDSLRVNPLEGDARTQVMKVGYEWLKQSIDEQGVEVEGAILVQFMQTTVALFKLGELPKESVVENYEKVNGLLNKIIAESTDEAAKKDAQNIIQPFVDTLFGKSGAADCEALVNILTPQFEGKIDDIDFITNMLRRLRRANCDESELVERATIRQYELDPSAEAAFNMARRLIIKGDIAKAKEYYKHAMEQETDKELLATYYLQYGKVLYSEKSYMEARDYMRKVLAIDPKLCEANILIGDIYVQSASAFQGTNLEKAAIFWVAVDYYNKARSSEDCSIDAAQKITDYNKHFPNKEDAFMEGLQEGQTYKVEGWINETTKVRF